MNFVWLDQFKVKLVILAQSGNSKGNDNYNYKTSGSTVTVNDFITSCTVKGTVK